MQYMQEELAWFFFWNVLVCLNIVAISCIQLPPYSVRRRHITGNFHPLLCWLVADRLRENYPHKS